jgi:hypothetical protein
MQPRLASIVREVQPAIVPEHESVGIMRIDPKIVMVEVKDGCVVREEMDELALVPPKASPSVRRVKQIVAENVELVLIVRRNAYETEVVADGGRNPVLIDLPPRVSSIVGTVELSAHDSRPSSTFFFEASQVAHQIGGIERPAIQ